MVADDDQLTAFARLFTSAEDAESREAWLRTRLVEECRQGSVARAEATRARTAEGMLMEAERRVAQLEGVVRWMLGEEGAFPQRKDGTGLYWWRRALRERAAVDAAKADASDKIRSVLRGA